MEKKEISLPEGITPAMVTEVKKKHGDANIRIIELPMDDNNDEFMSVLACVPTRAIVGQYRRYMESDPKKADEILVKNCILSRKDEVLADDGLFFGAVTGLAELIPVRKGIVKNV